MPVAPWGVFFPQGGSFRQTRICRFGEAVAVV